MNTIKLGSKGEDVKVLQKYLGINPDGDFGPKTLLLLSSHPNKAYYGESLPPL